MFLIQTRWEWGDWFIFFKPGFVHIDRWGWGFKDDSLFRVTDLLKLVLEVAAAATFLDAMQAHSTSAPPRPKHHRFKA